MQVSVDRDRCVGAGQCVRYAATVFDQGEQDGVVVLRFAHPPAQWWPDVREAAERCPSGAISIDDPAARPGQEHYCS